MCTQLDQPLNRQDYLDTHILALMHEFPIDENLVRANAIPDCVSRVCGCGDLDLTPLLVRRHELALGSEPLELLVHSLFLHAALALYQR